MSDELTPTMSAACPEDGADADEEKEEVEEKTNDGKEDKRNEPLEEDEDAVISLDSSEFDSESSIHVSEEIEEKEDKQEQEDNDRVRSTISNGYDDIDAKSPFETLRHSRGSSSNTDISPSIDASSSDSTNSLPSVPQLQQNASSSDKISSSSTTSSGSGSGNGGRDIQEGFSWASSWRNITKRKRKHRSHSLSGVSVVLDDDDVDRELSQRDKKKRRKKRLPPPSELGFEMVAPDPSNIIDASDPEHERRKVHPQTMLINSTYSAVYRIITFTWLFCVFWYWIWLLFLRPSSGYGVAGYINFVPFVIAELITTVTGAIFYLTMLNPVQRQITPLDQIEDFPTIKWPKITVNFTTFREPMRTVLDSIGGDKEMDGALAIAESYPRGKCKVNILADGFWIEVEKPSTVTTFRFDVSNNPLVRKDMEKLSKCAGQQQLVKIYQLLRERYKTPPSLQCIPVLTPIRPDCSLRSYEFRFSARDPKSGKPIFLSIYARVKPKEHHAKSGNLNNFLFNHYDPLFDEEYMCFFDADMVPHKFFPQHTLPCFYSWNHEAKKFTTLRDIAYVLTPQFFRSEDIVKDDILASKNNVFFNAIQIGRDGFDSCSFSGTNVVFSKAIISRFGFPYHTLTEDTRTGLILFAREYRSIYVNNRLAVGKAPVSPGQAMMQVKRWATGSIQILLNNIYIKCCCPRKDTPFNMKLPGFKQPIRMKFMQYLFHLDSMIWPFSSLAAVLYMFTTVFFLFTNAPPLTGGLTLLYAFVPANILRFILNVTVYRQTGVSFKDAWQAQQVWFAYSFAQCTGIFEALFWKFTGRNIVWFNTNTEDELPKTNLELCNVVIVCLVVAGIITNFIVYFASAPFLSIAAVAVALFILSQLLPVVSLSLKARNIGLSRYIMMSVAMLVVMVLLPAASVAFYGSATVTSPTTDPSLTVPPEDDILS